VLFKYKFFYSIFQDGVSNRGGPGTTISPIVLQWFVGICPMTMSAYFLLLRARRAKKEKSVNYADQGTNGHRQ
jgi:hypothetical protein